MPAVCIGFSIWAVCGLGDRGFHVCGAPDGTAEAHGLREYADRKGTGKLPPSAGTGASDPGGMRGWCFVGGASIPSAAPEKEVHGLYL